MQPLPYRCNIGGFVDQPHIGKVMPSSMIVFQIWPDVELDERSGMATSTRNGIKRLAAMGVTHDSTREFIELSFAADNPPDRKYLSGSQDQFGILLPGVHRLHYSGGFWPDRIETIRSESIILWMEEHLSLKQTAPRPHTLGDTIFGANINQDTVAEMEKASDRAWRMLCDKCPDGLKSALIGVQQACEAMIPRFTPWYVRKDMDKLHRAGHGVCLMGAGGGGYALIASDDPVDGAIRFRIGREG